MAKPNERRKNIWDEDEDDLDDTLVGVGERRRANSVSATGPTGGAKADDSAEVDRKIAETKLMLEQTHQMYLNYFSGMEKRAPVEKVKLLESKIAELQRNGTNITTARFKLSQFLAYYTQMKELWERKLRDKERR